MSHILYLECTLCHQKIEPTEDVLTCPTCGSLGILDVIYDYDIIKQKLSKDYFKTNPRKNIWRYLPFLPVKEAYTWNTLDVGFTPLYESRKFAEMTNTKAVFIKDDGLNPTLSLKDRASVIACVKALELGKTTIACSSTGNAASSLAGNAARLGLKTVIFVPKRAPIGKLIQLKAFGADLIKVDGDYKQAFHLSKQAIEHYGWYNRNAAINPYLVEGKKTVALEIAEQLHFKPTDWVIVSVGDGCTIAGVYKGFYDLLQVGLIDYIPKILGVQSEGCSPFVDAFHEGHDVFESEEQTIADSIAVGIPRNPVKGLNAVKQSHGSMIKVSDEAILDAMILTAKTEGVFSEPAAAASFAGFLEARKKEIIKPYETVTIISTGNGLKDPQAILKKENNWLLLKADLKEVIKHIEEQEGEDK